MENILYVPIEEDEKKSLCLKDEHCPCCWDTCCFCGELRSIDDRIKMAESSIEMTELILESDKKHLAELLKEKSEAG